MATPLKKLLRRQVTASVPYGVNPQIIITLYPNGILGMRESRRRREYCAAIGTVYQQAVFAAARADRKAAKLERKQQRKDGLK